MGKAFLSFTFITPLLTKRQCGIASLCLCISYHAWMSNRVITMRKAIYDLVTEMSTKILSIQMHAWLVLIKTVGGAEFCVVEFY